MSTADAVEIRTDHPRLFFNAESQDYVISRALHEENALYNHIKNKVNALVPYISNLPSKGTRDDAVEEIYDYGKESAWSAFVYLVEQGPIYLNLAAACIETSLDYYEECYDKRVTVDWRTCTRTHVAMAWDWLYNDLTEPARSQYMSRLIHVINNVKNAKPFISREHMSSYDAGMYGIKGILWPIGVTAYGTGIEPALVGQWLNEGEQENMFMLNYRDRYSGDDGGGSSMTFGYLACWYPYADWNFYYTMHSATGIGVDLSDKIGYNQLLTNYIFWNLLPSNAAPALYSYGDESHSTGHDNWVRGFLYTNLSVIQNIYGWQNPDVAALAEYLKNSLPKANQKWREDYFIYPFLSVIEPVSRSFDMDVTRIPQARHFEKMGQVFMSSGFQPEDVYCLFACGGELESHHHYDALHFTIYSDDSFLAIDSGDRYDEFTNKQHLLNYYSQSVAHNTILVHQPGEPPTTYWGQQLSIMDGGQHRIAGSKVQAFETNDYYVYVAGDATDCYMHSGPLPEKVSLVTRQMVFVPPKHFVIFDRVTSTMPDYPKTWLLHTVNEPQVQSNYFYADHENCRLFCKTLLPANADISTIGGERMEFWSAGQNWPLVVPDSMDEDYLARAGRWRVEVKPTQQRLADYFLHVLEVSSQGTVQMCSANLLEIDDSYGAALDIGGNHWQVYFNKSGTLGGVISCTDNVNLSQELTQQVQSQSGIWAEPSEGSGLKVIPGYKYYVDSTFSNTTINGDPPVLGINCTTVSTGTDGLWQWHSKSINLYCNGNGWQTDNANPGDPEDTEPLIMSLNLPKVGTYKIYALAEMGRNTSPYVSLWDVATCIGSDGPYLVSCADMGYDWVYYDITYQRPGDCPGGYCVRDNFNWVMTNGGNIGKYMGLATIGEVTTTVDNQVIEVYIQGLPGGEPPTRWDQRTSFDGLAYELISGVNEEVNEIEAEDAVLVGVSVIADSSASRGYRVGGFDSEGDSITFQDIGEAGLIRIAYSLDTRATRQCSLYVDGKKAETLYFSCTGSWDTFSVLNVQVNILNSVSLRLDAGDMMMNEGQSCASIDKIMLAEDTSCLWRSSLYPDDWQPPIEQYGQGTYLHDFSYAGYYCGEKPIPQDIPGVFINVTQSPYNADHTGVGDATNAIQAAIDTVGAEGGGVVYLPQGTYRVKPQGSNSWALRVRDDGVVIRGAGKDKTFVFNDETYMRTKRVFYFWSHDNWPTDWHTPIAGTKVNITEDLYHPATVIPVQSTASFSQGDWVVLRADATQEFIAEHGMTDKWDPASGHMVGPTFYRQITAVDPVNSTITIHIPMRYYLKTRDNARVYKVPAPLRDVGLEHLSVGMRENLKSGLGEEEYDTLGTAAYDCHLSEAIKFYHVLNGWIQHVNTYRPSVNTHNWHTLSNIVMLEKCQQVTVQNCFFGFPEYEGGGGNGYGIKHRGADCLVKDCTIQDTRHNYPFLSMWTTGNVIFRSTAVDGVYASDFHMYLSMANLFDSMVVDNDYLDARYRPYADPEHGHTTTESVIWNTYGTDRSARAVVSRQWKNGYVIGTRGPLNTVERGTQYNTAPQDILEGEGQAEWLIPSSLYLDQIKRRLNVPDNNKDGNVDMHDLSHFAEYWQMINCDWCGNVDYDYNKKVDIEDLLIFVEQWLN